MTATDVRTVLARSARTRVEMCSCGLLHVHAGPVSLHLQHKACEELTTTMARAMIELSRRRRRQRMPRLTVLPGGEASVAGEHGSPGGEPAAHASSRRAGAVAPLRLLALADESAAGDHLAPELADALRILLAIAFDRADLARRLPDSDDSDGAPMWPSTYFRAVADAACRDPACWTAVSQALDERCAPALERYERLSPIEVIQLFSEQASELDGARLTAALWSLVRRSQPELTKMIRRLSAELEILAMGRLSRPVSADGAQPSPR